jgi:hypothetical protein
MPVSSGFRHRRTDIRTGILDNVLDAAQYDQLLSFRAQAFPAVVRWKRARTAQRQHRSTLLVKALTTFCRHDACKVFA